MKLEILKEHRWLGQLAGDWTVETDAPESGETIPAWQMTARSLDGAWLVAESTGEMPGGAGTGTTIITLGYDPAKGHFVGTFVGSMMSHLWVYKGTLDAAEKVLTLEAEGPDFEVPGKTRLYRDIITIVDADTYGFNGEMQADDGSWSTIMESRYRRKR
jgi:hypothetical protein